MPGLRVKARGGFVEQQQRRLVDQRPRDRQPALHAARERLHAIVASFGELDEIEQLVCASARLAPRQVEIPAVDDEVLADRQLSVQRVLLRHDPDPGTDPRPVHGRVHIEDAQRPCGGWRDTADHPHRGGLAGPVGTQEAECLTPPDVEVDRVHSGERAELLGQPAGMDERRCLRFRHGRTMVPRRPRGPGACPSGQRLSDLRPSKLRSSYLRRRSNSARMIP